MLVRVTCHSIGRHHSQYRPLFQADIHVLIAIATTHRGKSVLSLRFQLPKVVDIIAICKAEVVAGCHVDALHILVPTPGNQ